MITAPPPAGWLSVNKSRPIATPAGMSNLVSSSSFHWGPEALARQSGCCSTDVLNGICVIVGHCATAPAARCPELPTLVRKRCKISGSNVLSVGAGEGNRTLVISLEGCCSTIELHPRIQRPIRRAPAQRCYQTLLTVTRCPSGPQKTAECLPAPLPTSQSQLMQAIGRPTFEAVCSVPPKPSEAAVGPTEPTEGPSARSRNRC